MHGIEKKKNYSKGKKKILSLKILFLHSTVLLINMIYLLFICNKYLLSLM